MRRRLLPLPLLFLLAACAYTSRVPLAAPDAHAFDEALFGGWIASDDDSLPDAGSLPVLVTRFNEHEALVEWQRWACADFSVPRHEKRRLRIFLTRIDSVAFLNIQDIAQGGFQLARYTVSGDELRLRFIGDGSDQRGLDRIYETSNALRAAVRARLEDPQLYVKEETVLRRVPTLAAR